MTNSIILVIMKEKNKMRSYVIKLKKYYDMGIYTYDAIVALYDKGKITEEEFNFIVGK